jgi:class 3 adenylate cyclase
MDHAVQAAVLFADVSGSTRLYESAGDTVAAAAIEQCVDLFRNKTEAVGGRVIKTIGDEVMSVFASADTSLNAAIAMQVGIAALPQVGGMTLGVRIGFHLGPVVEKDGDVFGDTVNLAARLTGLAQKDQIITSRETVDALSPALRISCRQLYSHQVKGKEQEVKLCEVMWRHTDETTAMLSTVSGLPAARHAQAGLRLKYHSAEIVLDEAHKSLLLGRDKSAELVVADAMASRSHCKIERRRDKFILADHSANGTYVTLEGDKEIMLRREEFTLRGHGWITFGQPRARTAEVVEFFCE